MPATNVPHLPWKPQETASQFDEFDDQLLPPKYAHLVMQPQWQFWWSRWHTVHRGTTTAVWCCICGRDYEYGGAVDVKAYLWASRHKCADGSIVLGEECVRLFR